MSSPDLSPTFILLVSSIPHQINDSIWLRGGSLFVGTGQLMSLYGQQPPSQISGDDGSLFEHVARHNGPLDEYHPQMILQCLLWGRHNLLGHLLQCMLTTSPEKVELVKNAFVNLARNLERTRDIHRWQPLAFEEFLKKDTIARAVRLHFILHECLTDRPPREIIHLRSPNIRCYFPCRILQKRETLTYVARQSLTQCP